MSKLRGIIGVAAAAAALVVSAPAAHADQNGADSAFLATLNRYGISPSELTLTPQQAVELGHVICEDLRDGTPKEREINEIYRDAPGVTDKQAGNLVSAAQLTICRDTF